jgi:ABC-type nitrate/sulfonate/bicarbonate transport system ATPase subunit
MQLRISHLSKSFQANAILSDVSFETNDTEFVAIVGPSGCGKTTMLSIIAGFENATSGSVSLDGRLLSSAGSDRLMIFQDSALFPHLTTRENIEFGLKHKGMTSHHRRQLACSALDAVGLGPFLHYFPFQLSGGMRKLVEIVRATILTNPAPLLLCDEALGQLDALTRAHTQDVIQRLWMESPRTVLWVTHDLEEACYCADRIIVMSPRPGTVTAELTIPFPRPRDSMLRTSVELQVLRRRLFDLLDAAEPDESERRPA